MQELVGLIIRETQDIILPDAFNVAHNRAYTLLVWWYQPTTEEFIYSEDSKSAHNDDQFKALRAQTGWLKGRLIGYRNNVYLVVYVGNFRYVPSFTSSQLQELLKKVKNVSNKHIDFVVDDRGVDLLAESKRGIK